MAANPALVQAFSGELHPAPFANETFVLKRPQVGFELDAVQTASGKWSATGCLYLSNVRVVFVADKADASGLAGFDMPLVYIDREKLNQPIFGCNNLAGRVWPAADGGGPGGSLPPHAFKVLFKAGGIGTFYPLFYALGQRARAAAAAPPRPPTAPPPSAAAEAAAVQELAHKAFVDPNDPSTVYLSAPVAESARLSYAPRYAANYGADDEPYESTGLRPMASQDVLSLDDKRLRLAEEGMALPAPPAPAPACCLANPAPLGLLCFGMTTAMLMFVDAEWAERAAISSVITYACFYGGFGQMVAGVFELIKGNTFAGTAFFSYGAFWLAFFTLNLLARSHAADPVPPFLAPPAFRVGQTLIFALWGFFTLGFFVPTLRKNGCLMTVFGSLTLTFFLLAGAQWSHACALAAGYVGFACGLSAIYTAFAELWHESLGVMAPGLRPVRFI
ncbi:satP [Scenedesmus sp. PABB004]|nr:satP [Scenedesmus sp. PABB004]